METNKEYVGFDLFRLFGALWHRAWAILLAIVLAGGAAFAYASFFITPRYESKALMYVNNSSFSMGSTSFSISTSELSAAQSLVATYTVILKTRTTLETVIEAAGIDATYEELAGMISASAVNGTEIFEIAVTSEDPKEAELLANTIAQILPERISDIVEGSSVRLVDYAVVPSTKASPNITLYTAVGILVGLAISCILILVAEMKDDLIHSEDYLLQAYEGVPLLAVIPDLRIRSSGGYYGEDYLGRRKKHE